MLEEGAPFHGEFSSADASGLTEANSRFALYGAGSTAAIVLGADDQVIISDILLTMAAGLTAEIYDGANNVVADGERIAKVILTLQGGFVWAGNTPHYCQKGTYPKVKTGGAGQIDVIIRGRIVRR